MWVAKDMADAYFDFKVTKFEVTLKPHAERAHVGRFGDL